MLQNNIMESKVGGHNNAVPTLHLGKAATGKRNAAPAAMELTQ